MGVAPLGGTQGPRQAGMLLRRAAPSADAMPPAYGWRLEEALPLGGTQGPREAGMRPRRAAPSADAMPPAWGWRVEEALLLAADARGVGVGT
jgi:hypothetical protein